MATEYEFERREPGLGESRVRWPRRIATSRAGWRYLAARGLSWDLARKNGWYVGEWSDGPRLVIPTVDFTFFQARALSQEQQPKYDSPHVPRGDQFVLVMPERSSAGPAVVCEGPLDALAAAECGFRGIGMMGAAPSREALYAAVHRCCRLHGAIVVPDADEAGDAFGRRVLALSSVARMVLVRLPAGAKDLADLLLARRRSLLDEAAKSLGA
jgi:hypothetical protein